MKERSALLKLLNQLKNYKIIKMGSFNKKGFVSNLPITAGDETVLIFLVKNKYEKELGGPVYSTDVFYPMLLPIYGTYDDYGKIEDVVKDENVKFIEELFGVDIDDLIEMVDDNAVGRSESADSDVKQNSELFKRLTFTLELKSVFDKHIELLDEISFKNDLGDYWLKKLGWVESGKTNDERYTKRFVHPQIKTFEMHSDGTWANSMHDGKAVRFSSVWGTYSASQLEKAMIEHGYTPKISNIMRKKTTVDLSWELTSKELLKSIDKVKALKQRLAEDDKNKTLTQDERDLIISGLYIYTKFGHSYNEGIRGFDKFFGHVQYEMHDLYFEKLYTPEFKKLATDYMKFNLSLSKLNLMYYPSAYGNQEQDYKRHMLLAEFYTKLMKKAVKENEEDEDDEE